MQGSSAHAFPEAMQRKAAEKVISLKQLRVFFEHLDHLSIWRAFFLCASSSVRPPTKISVLFLEDLDAALSSRRQVSRLPSSSNRAACFRTICSSARFRSEIVASRASAPHRALFQRGAPHKGQRCGAGSARPGAAHPREPAREVAGPSAAARLAASASAHAAGFSRSHACTHRR